MKNRLLFLIPLVAVPLFSCGQSNPTSSTTQSSTSATSSEEHEEPSSSTSSEDYTTTGIDASTATGIDSVKTFPAKVMIDEEIAVTDVVLVIKLSNGMNTEKHPDSLEYSFEGKNSGDTLTVTCKYKSFEITFDTECVSAPKDIISPAVVNSSTSYYKWSYTSDLGSSYIGVTKNSSDKSYFIVSNGTVTSEGLTSGIITNKAVSAISKVVVTFSSQAGSTNTGNLSMFTKETPYYDTQDLKSLSKTSASHVFTYSEDSLVQTYTLESDAHYIGFKNTGGHAAYIEKIEIFINEESAPKAIQSLELSGTVKAATDSTEWDFSDITVTGTFEGTITDDVTKFCTLSSATSIPSEAGDTTVEVKAVYNPKTDIEVTQELAGKVTQGVPTPVDWTYNTVKKGGTLTVSKFKTDSTNQCYTENNSTVDTDAYIQILNSSAYWSELPSKVSVTATIGGGSVKTLTGYEVRVVLLNTSGTEIADTETIIANKVEAKTGTEFSVSITPVEGVAGVRLVHKKMSSYNVRFYSLKLTYEN